MEKEIKGWDYLSYSLTAFGGLGLEVLYAFWLEPMIYGSSMKGWTPAQTIIHWILTCITWGLVAFYIVYDSQKRYHVDLFAKAEPVKLWQWGAVLIGIALSLIASYMDWNGFKVIIEFQRKGALLFTFQYIYYIVETILFMFIIVYAQKAFELWFKNHKIPYGGIICGLTWGLAHAFTKGSLLIGLEGIVIGFVMGAAYLLLNRDIKKTYVVLLIMFIL